MPEEENGDERNTAVRSITIHPPGNVTEGPFVAAVRPGLPLRMSA